MNATAAVDYVAASKVSQVEVHFETWHAEFMKKYAKAIKADPAGRYTDVRGHNTKRIVTFSPAFPRAAEMIGEYAAHVEQSGGFKNSKYNSTGSNAQGLVFIFRGGYYGQTYGRRAEGGRNSDFVTHAKSWAEACEKFNRHVAAEIARGAETPEAAEARFAREDAEAAEQARITSATSHVEFRRDTQTYGSSPEIEAEVRSVLGIDAILAAARS